jgi:hypothetical protein
MSEQKTWKGFQVKLKNRRISLYRIPKEDFDKKNKALLRPYGFGFRISAKRLPHDDEDEIIHKEKMDLTADAMFGLIQMWCKIEGFTIDIKNKLLEKE